MLTDHIGEKILPQRKEKLLSDIGRTGQQVVLVLNSKVSVCQNF